jgi:mRNA-degrading endonuclease RelE of RelBE toxin-antitoxin system
MMAALEEVADLEDINTHPGIRKMKGSRSDWYRLRVGAYRAVLRPEKCDGEDVIYVSHIGPRGDAY